MGAVPAAVADNAVLHHHPVIPAHPDTAQDRLHITAHTVAAGTEVGVVRPIMEVETITTIAVVMVITGTTAIIIHARIRVGITTAMTVTDVGVEEAVGVAEEATMAAGRRAGEQRAWNCLCPTLCSSLTLPASCTSSRVLGHS